MSIEDYEISCYVTPQDTIEPDDDSFSRPMFCINVVATFMPNVDDDDEEDDQSCLFDADCDVIERRLFVEQVALCNREASSSMIRQFLIEMKIPVQEYMLDRILDFANQMGSNKRYLDRKVLHLRVEIDVPPNLFQVAEDDEDEDDGDDDDDISSQSVTAASQSSIEALETIKVDGDSVCQCTICLEEMSIGSDAIRMPCLHLYHRICIVDWLQKSRVCPLCRFEIA